MPPLGLLLLVSAAVVAAGSLVWWFRWATGAARDGYEGPLVTLLGAMLLAVVGLAVSGRLGLQL